MNIQYLGGSLGYVLGHAAMCLVCAAASFTVAYFGNRIKEPVVSVVVYVLGVLCGGVLSLCTVLPLVGLAVPSSRAVALSPHLYEPSVEAQAKEFYGVEVDLVSPSVDASKDKNAEPARFAVRVEQQGTARTCALVMTSPIKQGYRTAIIECGGSELPRVKP